MTDRDGHGRFVKGNKAAVGNKGGRPRRSTEERFLTRLVESVSDDDFDAMIQSAIVLAREKGDIAALRLLLQYLIGMPTEYVKQDIEGTVTMAVKTYVGISPDDWDENEPAVE